MKLPQAPREAHRSTRHLAAVGRFSILATSVTFLVVLSLLPAFDDPERPGSPRFLPAFGILLARRKLSFSPSGSQPVPVVCRVVAGLAACLHDRHRPRGASSFYGVRVPRDNPRRVWGIHRYRPMDSTSASIFAAALLWRVPNPLLGLGALALVVGGRYSRSRRTLRSSRLIPAAATGALLSWGGVRSRALLSSPRRRLTTRQTV